MKISRDWLQTYFDVPLPEAQKLADALTFHAFEIESVEQIGRRTSNFDWILEIKVTPNRGHDCLSHRGVAKELSAILKLPLKSDPLRGSPELEPKADAVSISIENPDLCRRYITAHIRGVKVGPSPEWLRKSLEVIGQKSINNVVDASNYTMFSLGQPLHAFDASKLSIHDSRFKIQVRSAKRGEKMMALDDKEYVLSPTNLVIVDAAADTVIGIAGVKGGKASGVDEKTEEIILESANFDGVSTRRTATALKLRTDASERFQQVLSPECAAHGVRAAVDLILKVAGGELVGFADEYPAPEGRRNVSVSLTHVNRVLGTELSESDMADVFTRLDLPFDQKEGEFTIRVPFERLDLVLPEDLVEEVSRIVGYDKVPETELSPFPKQVAVNSNFYAAEHTREELTSQGYSEVFTSVFAEKGVEQVLNKVGGGRSYLRANLIDGLTEALERNLPNKDLLGLKEVRLFEIGTVWPARGGKKGGEEIHVATVGEKEKPKEWVLEPASASLREELAISSTERYKTFSRYPFVGRDIAFRFPLGGEERALNIIREETARFLARPPEVFDTYAVSGALTSMAVHLIFQSFEKTLTDEEVNEIMQKTYQRLQQEGFEIR